MQFTFPVDAVEVTVASGEVTPLLLPELSRRYLQISEKEAIIHVANVASYKVSNGNRVEVFPCKQTDPASIQLFLNGSALGAILHQRGVIPFHGSSFVWNGTGVMICGGSGAGKSSVATAFCRQGARLINDDVTPVQIVGAEPMLVPIRTRMKLWDDTLSTLQLEAVSKERIRPQLTKYYIDLPDTCQSEHPLQYLFILETHQKESLPISVLSGVEKFNALRMQIYRKLYLKGMPRTAQHYFAQLFRLASNIRVIRVVRPKNCPVNEVVQSICNVLEG
ncbi:MAG: hypothetical protein AB7C90_10490 [Bacteroidales bacterium]